MKKLKFSSQTQDYIWGVLLTLSVFLWMYVAALFI